MNNREEENPEQKSDSTSALKSEWEETIELNGSWENKGRSITAAAFAGLIGIGALYFNVQSLIMMMLVFIYKAIGDIDLPAGFMERIDAIVDLLKTPILIALIISQYLFMLYPTIWIVKRWHTTEIKKYLRIQLCSFKEITLAVLITVLLLPFCYYLSYLILKVLDIPEVFESLGNQLFTAHSTTEFVFLVFVVAVTPAICEEIFFRGYVQRTLERTTGAKSFIITGIIFGLFHMQPLSLITLSILGVLFSFFYYRSKSIYPSSAAHFTNNLIAILLLYVQSQGNEFLSEGNIPEVWVILSTLIAAGLIMFYIKVTKRSAMLSI